MKHHTYSLGQIFRDERKKQGLGVPQLAVMTGLPLSTIYNFERGVVSSPLFTTVAVLARALQLSLDELAANLSFNDDRNSKRVVRVPPSVDQREKPHLLEK